MSFVSLFDGSGILWPALAVVAAAAATAFLFKATRLRKISAARAKGESLSFSGKVDRLRGRLKNPEWRRYGAVLLAGKALGIVVLFAMIAAGTTLIRTMSGTPLHAQQTAPAAADGAAMPAMPPGTMPAAAAAPPDPYKTTIGGSHQRDQHGLGAARRIPRVRHAGGVHDARSGLLSQS